MDQKEPKSPHDEKKKDTIETLAQHVAKHGKEFEKNSRRGEGKAYTSWKKERSSMTITNTG